MPLRRTTALRVTGLLAGCVTALLYLNLGRVAEGGTGFGAGLTVSAGAADELSVRPAATLLSATGLRPGGRAARGSLALTNPTEVKLRVRPRLRLSGPGRGLDRFLRVRVEKAGRPLLAGALGDVRGNSDASFALGPGEIATLKLMAWLPASAGPGYQALVAETKLGFATTIVGGRR